jgi:hypothetical protein
MATFLAVGLVLALGLHTVRSALDLLHLATLCTYRQQLAIIANSTPVVNNSQERFLDWLDGSEAYFYTWEAVVKGLPR